MIHMVDWPVLPYKGMSQIYSKLICETPRGLAPSIKRKSLNALAQESNAASVTDSYEKVQIERECLVSGNETVGPPMLIAELYFALGTIEGITQFLADEYHFW
jgi:hypothetical protein